MQAVCPGLCAMHALGHTLSMWEGPSHKPSALSSKLLSAHSATGETGQLQELHFPKKPKQTEGKCHKPFKP